MAAHILLIVGHDQLSPRYFWQWFGSEPTAPRSYSVDSERLAAALVTYHDAVPEARDGEPGESALSRVFGSGALSDVTREREFADELAELLLPHELRAEMLDRFHRAESSPFSLRLMPSASCARLPWPLISVRTGELPSADVRLIEIANIAQELPAGVHAGRARTPRSGGDESRRGKPLYIIDPRNLTQEGQVLDLEAVRGLSEKLSDTASEDSVFGEHFDRKNLHRALNAAPPPARMLYVGHAVTADDSPGSTALLLSDPANMYGVTSLYDELARPLSALDLLEGTRNALKQVDQLEEVEKLNRNSIVWPALRGARQSGADIWPMPSRVILVACSSGGDMGNPEPFGLVTAMVNAGAEYVTATRWTLPTDHAMATYGADPSGPLVRAALALDQAHSESDPVAAVSDWQRVELRRWRDPNASDRMSPLVWAAFDTFLGTAKPVT